MDHRARHHEQRQQHVHLLVRQHCIYASTMCLERSGFRCYCLLQTRRVGCGTHTGCGCSAGSDAALSGDSKALADHPRLCAAALRNAKRAEGARGVNQTWHACSGIQVRRQSQDLEVCGVQGRCAESVGVKGHSAALNSGYKRRARGRAKRGGERSARRGKEGTSEQKPEIA